MDVLSQVRDVNIVSLPKQAVTSVDTDHLGVSCVGINIIVRETQTQFHFSPTAQKNQLVKYYNVDWRLIVLKESFRTQAKDFDC